MKDPKFTKEILDTAICAFAENIRDFFKRVPPPAEMTKREAAGLYIRMLAMSVTNIDEKHNVTTQECLSGIAASAFLAEHIDDIITKAIENEGDQTTVTE